MFANDSISGALIWAVIIIVPMLFCLVVVLAVKAPGAIVKGFMSYNHSLDCQGPRTGYCKDTRCKYHYTKEDHDVSV